MIKKLRKDLIYDLAYCTGGVKLLFLIRFSLVLAGSSFNRNIWLVWVSVCLYLTMNTTTKSKYNLTGPQVRGLTSQNFQL